MTTDSCLESLAWRNKAYGSLRIGLFVLNTALYCSVAQLQCQAAMVRKRLDVLSSFRNCCLQTTIEIVSFEKKEYTQPYLFHFQHSTSTQYKQQVRSGLKKKKKLKFTSPLFISPCLN